MRKRGLHIYIYRYISTSISACWLCGQEVGKGGPDVLKINRTQPLPAPSVRQEARPRKGRKKIKKDKPGKKMENKREENETN